MLPLVFLFLDSPVLLAQQWVLANFKWSRMYYTYDTESDSKFEYKPSWHWNQ